MRRIGIEAAERRSSGTAVTLCDEVHCAHRRVNNAPTGADSAGRASRGYSAGSDAKSSEHCRVDKAGQHGF
jgi:hypothetical protein